MFVGVENRRQRTVTHCTELFAELDDDGALIPDGEVRNVLEEDGPWLEMFDNPHEASPHLGARIVCRAHARLDKAADLRSTCPGEGLAWDTTRNEVNAVDSPRPKVIYEVVSLGEVTAVPNPTEVASVGLDRPGIVVRAEQNRESRVVEPEAQSTRSAEQIDRRGPPLGADPPPDGCEVRLVGRPNLGLQPQGKPTVTGKGEAPT
jgi:hypothetical protein